MASQPIPDDVIRVTEPELQEKLSTYIDRVAFAEDELVVTRGGQPIAAVISMDGWRALRHVAEGVVEELLGDERLRRTMVGSRARHLIKHSALSSSSGVSLLGSG